MTTTAPLGVVSLLEGVVLALTPPGTKNLPSATWWTPALPLKLFKPKVFDEVFSVLVLFLALRRGSIAVKSKLLCRLGGKLGNDNIFP
uniref:Secreted protein n=1 Tax=Oryza meridionalis TaxID=40149 RepID=A0A0E0DNK5_9ORYZ